MQPYYYDTSTALVTGASRGIGAAIAHALAKRGVKTIVLTARSRHELEALAAELTAAYGTQVITIVANLAEAHAPARIKKETDRRKLTVDLLINNAGFGTHGLFDTTDAEKSRDMVEVNIQALTTLTHLYLPGMIQNNRGGVINIASTAAFQPVPFMAVYAATKAFVLSFTEALAVEVKEQGATGVRVIALCPGGTQTNFGDGMLRGHFENAPQHTPERVATETLQALDRNASVAVVGSKNYAMTFSGRLFPRAIVAKVAGEMFRPADLPVLPSGRPSRLRLLIMAATASAAAVAIAALLVGRNNRSDS